MVYFHFHFDGERIIRLIKFELCFELNFMCNNFTFFSRNKQIIVKTWLKYSSIVTFYVLDRIFEQIYLDITSNTVKLRKSRPEVFFQKGVLRNFAKFIRKHLCQCLFFNKVVDLRPAILLKKDSDTVDFLWILQKFLRTLFYIEPPVAVSGSLPNASIK